MTEDYTRLLGTLLQLPLNLYFKIKIKRSEFSELAVPLSSPGKILGFFFFFFPSMATKHQSSLPPQAKKPKKARPTPASRPDQACASSTLLKEEKE